MSAMMFLDAAGCGVAEKIERRLSSPAAACCLRCRTVLYYSSLFISIRLEDEGGFYDEIYQSHIPLNIAVF